LARAEIFIAWLSLAQYNFRAEPEPDPGSAQAGSCGAL